MLLVDRYALPPGQCFLCGSCGRGDEPILDTGREFESGPQTHRVYVCRQCGLDIGERFGMGAPELYAALSERCGVLAQTVEDLEFQVNAMRSFAHAAQALVDAKIEAVVGYPCRAEGCGRVLITAAARASHERIHDTADAA